MILRHLLFCILFFTTSIVLGMESLVEISYDYDGSSRRLLESNRAPDIGSGGHTFIMDGFKGENHRYDEVSNLSLCCSKYSAKLNDYVAGGDIFLL